MPFNEFIDTEQELNKLRTEVENRKGFLNSILKKINNEKKSDLMIFEFSLLK